MEIYEKMEQIITHHPNFIYNLNKKHNLKYILHNIYLNLIYLKFNYLNKPFYIYIYVSSFLFNIYLKKAKSKYISPKILIYLNKIYLKNG